MISHNTSAHHTALPDLHDNIVQHGVMVIDDSSMHRFSALNCLRAFGIGHLYEAVDGKMALDQLAQLQPTPAVILLDLEMPVMDGIEVLQQLAQHSCKPAVVLVSRSDEVLISAVATMAEALGIQLLGAFRKPVSPAELVDALCHYQVDEKCLYQARASVVCER